MYRNKRGDRVFLHSCCNFKFHTYTTWVEETMEGNEGNSQLPLLGRSRRPTLGIISHIFVLVFTVAFSEDFFFFFCNWVIFQHAQLSYVALSTLFLCDCWCCCLVRAMGGVNQAMTSWLLWGAEVWLSAGNQDYCWMHRRHLSKLVEWGSTKPRVLPGQSRGGNGLFEPL